MSNQWTIRGATASDLTHDAVFHGVVAKEIWYSGEKIWDKLDFSRSVIELALDNSGSMEGSSIEILRYCAKQFCERIASAERKVGIVTFGTSSNAASQQDWDMSVKTLLPFTSSVSALTTALDGLAVEEYWCGTPIGKAIEVSHRNLVSAEIDERSKRLLILFSDGDPSDQKNNKDSANHARRAAQAAKEDGCFIMTMRLGSSASNQLMRDIASTPMWAFVSASINDMFDAVYKLLGG